MAVAVLFRCPASGANVEGRVSEETFEHGPRTYVAIDCAACGGIHLVNPPTGKTLDEPDRPEPP